MYEVLTMSEQGKVGACPSRHLTQVKGVLHEENTTSVGHDRGGGLAVRACCWAQPYYGGATASPMATATATASPTATATASPMATATATATPTATATASPTATATATPLPRTGGAPLVPLVTLAASLTLIASGVGALMLVRRRVS